MAEKGEGQTADQARSSVLDKAPKDRTEHDRDVMENTADAIRIANELNAEKGTGEAVRNNLKVEPVVDSEGRFTGKVRIKS